MTREAAAVPIRLPSRSFVEGLIPVVIWSVLSVSNKFGGLPAERTQVFTG